LLISVFSSTTDLLLISAINPFAKSGLDVRDLQFIELLCLWIYTNYKDKLSYNNQIRLAENLKIAALYDIDSTTINGKETLRESGLRVLSEMKAFYGETELIKYQIQKLTEPGKRYAERVSDSLKKNYTLDNLSRNN
jgi:gamma-glutamylcysteine synthetase